MGIGKLLPRYFDNILKSLKYVWMPPAASVANLAKNFYRGMIQLGLL